MASARILVVDDEPSTVEIISRFLTAKGHRVAGAGSAEEAADLLRGGTFDFVMLDVVLPGRTGLQALAEMRKLTRSPIYIMSGMSDDESRKDAILLGATGFFAKPIDFGAVLAAVDALPPAA
jgi:two-component system phosphate regulon response regulator OmpR